MKPEKFIRDVGRLLDGCSTESIETWIQWAKECVESEQYLDFKPLPTEQAVSVWLDSYYASFYFIKQDFGKSTAEKLVSLSNSALCLYPYEMREAAKVLKAGGSLEQIEKMIVEGTLEDYKKLPTLEDVRKSVRNRREKER